MKFIYNLYRVILSVQAVAAYGFVLVSKYILLIMLKWGIKVMKIDCSELK